MQFLLNKATVLTHPHSPSPASADEASAYSRSRIVLHWLSAAIILWATFSGFGVVLLDPQDPIRQWVESFNPQLTSLFIPFFAWRLWLAIRATPPREHSSAQQRLANAAHKAIYAAVSGVLITGVLMMSHPVTLLALIPLPQLVHSKMALLELHELHHLLCAALAGLVALHLAAVVMHQVRGKSVLGRMIGR
ncbi:cytochrome b [Pseudomonas sp. NPDC090202]|uniref:cytochrome b n=1 Tax=unclassified Pseudomonas TaxID=196821 RepID=UPI003803ED55